MDQQTLIFEQLRQRYFVFWNSYKRPYEPAGYTFLATALHMVGRAMYPGDWLHDDVAIVNFPDFDRHPELTTDVTIRFAAQLLYRRGPTDYPDAWLAARWDRWEERLLSGSDPFDPEEWDTIINEYQTNIGPRKRLVQPRVLLSVVRDFGTTSGVS